MKDDWSLKDKEQFLTKNHYKKEDIETLRLKLIGYIKQWGIDFEIEGIVFENINPIDRLIKRINKYFGVE